MFERDTQEEISLESSGFEWVHTQVHRVYTGLRGTHPAPVPTDVLLPPQEFRAEPLRIQIARGVCVQAWLTPATHRRAGSFPQGGGCIADAAFSLSDLHMEWRHLPPTGGSQSSRAPRAASFPSSLSHTAPAAKALGLCRGEHHELPEQEPEPSRGRW